MLQTLRDGLFEWPAERVIDIWDNVRKNGLWRRILKVVVATSIVDAIMLIPAVEVVVGKAAYLAGVTTAFGHPGRRFGQMVEALALAAAGTLLGTGWSILGIYLGSLVIESNPPAAYTIKGIFLLISLLLHGFFRSHTPRIFLGTVLFIIVSVVNLISPAKTVTPTNLTQIIYPIFIAMGILLIVNLTIFPEFSSSYLGGTVTNGLHEITSVLRQSTNYFTYIEGSDSTKSNGENSPQANQKISTLTASKATIRTKVTTCKTAERECNFELAYSTLSPGDLASMNQAMAKLTGNVSAIIGACESKFALLGDNVGLSTQSSLNSLTNEEEKTSLPQPDSTATPKHSTINLKEGLGLVKPHREIESGDPDLLKHFIGQMTPPFKAMGSHIDHAMEVIIACISYAYRVPRLPSGAKTPAGIEIEEIDIYTESMRQAIETFDATIQTTLEAHGIWHNVREDWPDPMPREEIFLISSFYLNMRQAATHIVSMLDQARELVDQYRRRKGRRRLYAPRIWSRSWLYTGGGEDQDARGTTNPSDSDRGEMRAPDDEGDEDEGVSKHVSRQKTHDSNPLSPTVTFSDESGHRLSWLLQAFSKFRLILADVLESLQYSSDLQYAFKVAIASFLVLWPAFVAQWNEWYSLERGIWAALQLILISEPTTGSSLYTFILRAFGTTLGCLWGWAAYEAGSGNRIVCGVMIAIGIVPAAYVIVGSKYIKAGIVSSVSITVVALATEVRTVAGTATENYLKRFIAFTIGGIVALIVQFSLLPVKARTRMVESLTNCLRHIQEMEHAIAFGIESNVNLDPTTALANQRFEKASRKAKAALGAAEGYIPFCSKEPRLKGSFSELLLVYKEIAFVLHQIIDRMDNMVTLRTNYGSGPLQEYNAQIISYRRNLAASIIVCLFAVQEGLFTRLPLPQFVPSARLAHIRLINRVREVVQSNVGRPSDSVAASSTTGHTMKQNFLSWNATAMSLAEIIEYLEELVELTKLLVGANEFRTGLLYRPSIREHIDLLERQDTSNSGLGNQPLQRRRTFGRASKGAEDAEIPYTFKRVQTRKFDAVLKKRRTLEEKG